MASSAEKQQIVGLTLEGVATVEETEDSKDCNDDCEVSELVMGERGGRHLHRRIPDMPSQVRVDLGSR